MNTHALCIVLVCAGVTLLLRALPFACFGGKNGVPPWVASLVVYCLKSVPFGSFADGVRQLAAAAVVVALHLAKGSTLLSIAGGTAVYMILIRL